MQYYSFCIIDYIITALIFQNNIFLVDTITILQQYKPSLCFMNPIYNSPHKEI
jgi:hypothetical protein